jgi:AcrR family transcriptional regulator
MARPSTDLTREAWLKAGQALLRSSGLKALRLRPLAASLNISTGSFYHHFKDFDGYLGQLADYYSGEQLTGNLARICAGAASPRDQILLASRLALEQDLPRLVLAMRAWAHGDPRALAAVQVVDSRLMTFFAERLTAMGFSGDEAAARAFMLVASSSLDAEPPGGANRSQVRDRIMAILCPPPGGS